MTLKEFLQHVKAGTIWGPSSPDFDVALARWIEAEQAGLITFRPNAVHRESMTGERKIDLFGPARLTSAGERALVEK